MDAACQGLTDEFVTAYARWEPQLGCPENNGARRYVHNVFGVCLQDYYQPDSTLRFEGSDGWTALIYYDGMEPEANAEPGVNLVRSGFWGTYKCLRAQGHAVGGATLLGAPINEEDLEQPGLTRQDFEHGYMRWNGTVITVHLDGCKDLVEEEAVRDCVGAGALARACRRAGIEPVGWHKLRHTFASHLVAKGVPLPTVQQLLGHASIAMTMRYAHLAPNALVQAIAVLEPPEKLGHPVGNAASAVLPAPQLATAA